METTGNRALVQFFYGEVLSSTTAPDLGERMARSLAPGWESIGGYGGPAKTRDQFGAQLAGFGKLIPDLKWDVEEIIESGDRFVVRGRATGTPAGELFGVPPSGRKFEIMSIDIHTVQGGRIARTYHVEDWAGAIKQLAAKA